MDKLRKLGACHLYSARDYSLESERDGGGDDGGHGAALKEGAKGAGVAPAPVSVPESPIMARWESPSSSKDCAASCKQLLR
jgi:hypothetical protein